MQDRHLERAEQLRAAVVAGEAQIAVVGRHARDEAEDPDEQEDDADERGDRLDGGALAHLPRFNPIGGTPVPERRTWTIGRTGPAESQMTAGGTRPIVRP